MTEAKYDELVQKLTEFNVSLKDVNGEYRSTYDIMADIASKWDKMTSMQQAALATALSGTRQQATFYSIITQFKEASGAMEQMSNSAGELEKSYSIYMDSAQAKINQFKAAFQELSMSVFSSDTIGNIVQMGTGLLGILDTMARANSLLPSIVASIGAIKAYKLGKSIESLADLTMGNKIGLILTAISGIVSLVNSIKEMGEFFGWWDSDEAEEVVRTTAEVEEELKQISNTVNETANSFKSLKTSTDEIIPRFVQLSSGVDAFGKNLNLTDEEYQEYLSLSNKLAELFPSINMGMDVNGNAMLRLGGNAEELTTKLNDLVEAQRKVANQEIASKLPDVIKDIEELNERVDKAKAKYVGLNEEVWKSIYKHGADGKIGNLTTTFKAKDYGNESAAAIAASQMMQRAAEMGIRGHLYQGTNGWHVNWSYENFDPEKAKQVYEDGLTQNERIVKDAEKRIKERWKAVNPLLSAWMQTDVDYSELSTQMQEIAATVLSGIDFSELGITTESGMKDYISKYIIAPLKDSGDDVKKAFSSIADWQAQLKSGKITPEEFASKTKDAFDKLKGSLSDDQLDVFVRGLRNAGFEGENFDAIVEKIAESWSKVSESATASLTDLSDSLTNLKTKYDVITKAQEEMRDGGVTADTIKSLKDAIGDDKSVSYLDFLYKENGILKLNIEAWKEYSDIEINKNKQSIEKTIEDLEAERDALLKQKQALMDSNKPAHQWLSEMDDIDEALKENNAEIEANQNKLKLYEGLYENAALKLDAYSVALEGFKSVSDRITDVSGSLTTVADLQERVREGFTLSIEEALKFADVYPEILNNATATANGEIQLNADVTNAFIRGKELELKSSLDAKINELTAERNKVESQKEYAEMQLKIVKQVGEGEGKISKESAEYRINIMNILKKKLADALQDETTANKLACEAMDGNFYKLDEQIAKVANDSSINMAEAAKTIAENMANNLLKTRQELYATATQAMNVVQVLLGNTPVASLIGRVGGGSIVSNAKITLSSGKYNGTTYTDKNTGTYTLQEFTSTLETEIKNYEKAMAQIDGQIAALRALRNTSLDKMSTSYKEALKKASNGSSENKSANSEDNWFTRLYKLHQHLLNMDAESVKDYLNWLDVAYKQAYKEGLITLDDYYKYCEEVYKKLQELFNDYLSDVEHEISMRSAYEGENKKIISLYRQLLADVEKEVKAARAQGLKDTDEYIQNLQSKYIQYRNAIKDIEDKAVDSAKDAVDKLVDIRIKMLKQDIEKEKDNIKKKLDLLKEFYDKQKQMLKDQADEEKYLEEQAEKRKAVVDIQDKLNALELDNSAAATKKKLQLSQDLVNAQKELDDFEKERARKNAEDALDKLYEQQEKELNAQEKLLEQKEGDAKALYEQALEDIKNGSVQLYEEMIQWNDKYGDGIKDTIKNAWEEAYKALLDYKNLFDKTFNDVNLANATGYVPSGNSWNKAPVSSGGTTVNPGTTTTSGSSSAGSSSGSTVPKTTTTTTGGSTTTKTTSTTATLDDNTKKMVAAAIWNGTMGWGVGDDRAKKLTEVFGANNGIQALVSQGVGKGVTASSAYSYLNMRKKFKGYASGTNYASMGLHAIDELGTETIFTSRDGNKYMMFTGGEKVLTAQASDFLYRFANRGAELLSRLFGMSPTSFGGLRAAGNIEIATGDIIINGSADKATVSEIRRAQRENVEMILKEFKKLNR